MREIINEITCDTEKAELIATATEGTFHDDKYWYQKTYRTADGHYFRYVQSNANSEYKHGKIELASKEEALSYWFQKGKRRQN